MRECKQVKKLLSRYLDKETNGGESAFVKEHLTRCRVCNEEYLGLLQVKQLMLEKERKSLPADYLVSHLREDIAGQRYAKEKPSWIFGMGNLSRRLIPVPAAVIVLSLVFLIFNSGQQVSEYSLEEHILTGSQTTTETAVRLILGAQN
jgi:predicted anti-sigma-YlaC factor YlaD